MHLHHSFYTLGVNSLPSHGELSVLFSGHAKPRPSHQVGPAVRNYYLLHTVMSGRGTFEIEGKQYDCERGDTFIIFPEVLFTYTSDAVTPWYYRWVAFKGPLSQPLLDSLGMTPAQPIVHLHDLRDVIRIYRRLEYTLKHSAYPELADLEANGLLRLMLKEFGVENAGRLAFHTQSAIPDIDRQIKQAVRWLSLQYAQQISIEDLSRTLGYHRTHLSKMFKQATGLSPMKFLLKVRMERARELLDGQKHLTIDHVASSVGFTDALYFSKQFRKWYGSSPTEYRAGRRTNA
ncbi:AraC family transcriptional regulator [Paenibacillus mendelii]|uniref:Helix-turn-helix domain-containing protein n=1 Tax=Paenibacillus mendelii TaxID=206163 RepID=A0ABV6JB80_9BACL|nr:AraC family transcriptional regulator [Paenibacillus mendelii]MCQ6558499.1 AraC family transcriptional regulator [Paenibacillus mendelii]